MSEADLIVGGGPAGAALAIRLAQAGLAPTVLERSAGPRDVVCGEFLSYEAVNLLRRLDVDPMALGAVAVETVAVCAGGRRAAVRLPFKALSLSRRTLDEALLSRAEEAGARVRRGVRITSLHRRDDGWRAAAAGGERFDARRLFLATGKHDIRGWRRPPGRQPDLIGFKQHLQLPPAAHEALGRTVELHLFPAGYAGLEPVEGGRANLCLVVRRGAFIALGGRFDQLLDALRRQPQLGARLAGATSAAPLLSISAIPYGHVRARSDGSWRLGDQAAVIPSFAGEGMAMALHSAQLAADHALAGRTADDFQAALHSHVAGQVGLATLISQALVHPWAQAAISAGLSAAPGLARLTALGTRLPRRAQAATGASA